MTPDHGRAQLCGGKSCTGGGLVGSQVQIGSFELPGYRETTVAPGAGQPKTARRKRAQPEGTTRQFHAQDIEFVARPGQAEKLRKAIRLAKRNSEDACDGFVGRLVFVSAEEERLVTVVTLWDGTEDEKRRDESSEQVKKLLQPYVDRWLRAGRFTAFFSTPELFPGGVAQRERQAASANQAVCHRVEFN